MPLSSRTNLVTRTPSGASTPNSCLALRFLANAAGYHCVWLSHQLSAFQGRALQRGSANLVYSLAALPGRRVRQAGGLFIPHKYLLSKIIQNLNNSFGSSYTTICKQFCSGGWSSTNLGKRRLCKIYNSPFAITFTGKISLARDVGDKKAGGNCRHLRRLKPC